MKGLLIVFYFVQILLLSGVNSFALSDFDLEKTKASSLHQNELNATSQMSAIMLYEQGLQYEIGEGVVKDYAKAVTWYEKAATKGHPQAMENLGRLYSFGKGVSPNRKLGENWYRKAVTAYQKKAGQGDVDAMRGLGECLEDGRGVAEDIKQAVLWYHKAAAKGDAIAMYNLGCVYRYADLFYGHAHLFENNAVIVKDNAEQETQYWYEKAAAIFLEKAAEGDIANMMFLSVIYKFGCGVAEDKKREFYWMQQAVEHGSLQAMFFLASFYEIGRGVVKDCDQAIAWYRKAADKGDEQSMNALGDIYFKGKCREKDYNLALIWYQKAVKYGHSDSMFSLGQMYWYGNGVSQNKEQAFYWFQEAASREHYAAKEKLKEVGE